MTSPAPLKTERLRRELDPEQLQLTTPCTTDGTSVVGQEGALNALDFGIAMPAADYHLFVLGDPAVDRLSIVRRFLERRGRERERPADWCYVNNFDDPQKPEAFCLPPGRGVELRQDLVDLIDDLRAAIPAAFETEEYRSRRTEIEADVGAKRSQLFGELSSMAQERGALVLHAPAGVAIAPAKEGEALTREQFEQLSDDERQEIESTIEELSEELRKRIESVPQLLAEGRRQAKELDREIMLNAVRPLLKALLDRWTEVEAATSFLSEVGEHLVENVDDFRPSEGPMLPGMAPQPSLERYSLNLLVDNSKTVGAPVIYESNPTYANLVGRVEHQAAFGALVTDFTMIRAGALHRANGGYLVLDAERVLTSPYAWQGLRQALQERHAHIEPLDRTLSLMSTSTLEPSPVPLDLKVVLVGSRHLYYLLAQHNDDFRDLFKVAVDFEDDIERTDENCQLFAQHIVAVGQEQGLLDLEPPAVARVLDELSRRVSDSEKLSVHGKVVRDLLCESSFWADRDGSETIGRRHVEAAVEAKKGRLDRIQRRVLETIDRETLLIDTAGEAVGQVNGLSTLQIGEMTFGRPTRITATVRMGVGDVIDVERETKLGGAIHSKGMLIIQSYIGARYARERALSLKASVVFEQSYGGVDGDSASLAETCVLLSAIARIPLRQTLAVTGSVNQLGRVQAVGGVNEKIEGFFEVCRRRGLTGDQGVLIPEDTVKNLMLDREVVEACGRGDFSIYPVRTVDEALTLLTGLDAGCEDEDSSFPEGSVNRRVTDSLAELTELRRELLHVNGADREESHRAVEAPSPPAPPGPPEPLRS